MPQGPKPSRWLWNVTPVEAPLGFDTLRRRGTRGLHGRVEPAAAGGASVGRCDSSDACSQGGPRKSTDRQERKHLGEVRGYTQARRLSIPAIQHPWSLGRQIATRMFGPHPEKQESHLERPGSLHPAEDGKGEYCIPPSLLDERSDLGPCVVR